MTAKEHRALAAAYGQARNRDAKAGRRQSEKNNDKAAKFHLDMADKLDATDLQENRS